MQDIEINGHKITLYRASEELPIKRYAKFNRYNLLESGVGSDINSIMSHFAKLFELLTFKLSEEALEEAKNLYFNFYLSLEEINVTGMAFAVLVHSIDGQEITDLSEDNLKVVVEKLSTIGLTQSLASSINLEVKKKIRSELKMYAPSYFNDADTMEFFANIKRKIKLLAESIEANKESEINEVDKFFASYYTPQNFNPNSPDNALIKMDTYFEDLCTTLESNGVAMAANLSTMNFYIKLEYFKRLSKSIQAEKAA